MKTRNPPNKLNSIFNTLFGIYPIYLSSRSIILMYGLSIELNLSSLSLVLIVLICSHEEI
jgi:hypothetical protein